MKKIFKKFNDIFGPKQLQGLDSMELLDAFNDPSVRKQWMWEVYEELKRMNLCLDKQLLNGHPYNFYDLCARRKAYQDVLDAILSAKRQISTNNPAKGGFDLDAVTGASV